MRRWGLTGVQRLNGLAAAQSAVRTAAAAVTGGSATWRLWVRRMVALCVCLLSATLVACGGSIVAESSSPAKAGDAYAEQEAAQMPQAAPAPGYSYDMDGDAVHDAGDVFGRRLESTTKAKPRSVSVQRGQDSPDADLPTKGKHRPSKLPPQVVYMGFLKLRVRRVLEAIDTITQATEERGGYIESMTQDAVVVRVPADDFEGVMAAFAEFGEVIDRSVKARDVSQRFTDLAARLAVAKEARARLLSLLAEVKDVKERLRIVAEVKRLTEQIEGIESTLATLQNLVDYFTITIALVPMVDNDRATTYSSPFPWVRGLSAHEATLFEGKGEFTFKPPSSFVVFDEDDEYRAQAADTAQLRAARIDNEPKGDAAFWMAAVHHELLARGEKVVGQASSGQVHYELYVNDAIKPRYYLVGVATAGQDLFVIEAFFPNKQSFDEHRAAVVSSLATFKAD